MRRPVYRSSFKPRSVRKSESRAKQQLIVNLVIVVFVIFVFFTWVLPFIIGSLGFLNKNKPKVDVESLKIDEAIAPPVLYIPFESTNSATLSVSGYASPLSKVEVYVGDAVASSVTTDGDGKFSADSIVLEKGQNNIYAVTLNDSDKRSLPSKTIKLYYSDDKPKLDISEPADNDEINGGDKKIKVSGATDPDNSVTINGATVIVNSDGNFSSAIGLNDGDNTITIEASNSFGNKNSVQKKVKYNPQSSPSPSANP